VDSLKKTQVKDSQAGPEPRPQPQNPLTETYKSILVCYDGSDNAMRALLRGVSLARERGCKLSVVVAADTLSRHARTLERYYEYLRADILGEAREFLSRAMETAKSEGIPSVQGSVEEGYPADMITAKASEIDADLIIVGRRGVRGIQRLLLGSVSSSVVDNSACDVLVVK
jgi:nucleotide-binding universal stress UspA family protein